MSISVGLETLTHLASPAEWRRPRLVLTTALGDRYRAKVSDDGMTVGLWHLVT